MNWKRSGTEAQAMPTSATRCTTTCSASAQIPPPARASAIPAAPPSARLAIERSASRRNCMLTPQHGYRRGREK